LKDYLVLLSLYQTCRYRGISFLKFLRTAGSLPTFANSGTTPITVLPGLPAGLAANIVPGDPATEFFPFGIWFANSTTLYVADEGSGKNTASDNPTNDPNNGLEKWSLVDGVWHLDYTLQNGLNLGVQYSVPNGPNGEVYPTNLNPATDGPRAGLRTRLEQCGQETVAAIFTPARCSEAIRGMPPYHSADNTQPPRIPQRVSPKGQWPAGLTIRGVWIGRGSGDAAGQGALRRTGDGPIIQGRARWDAAFDSERPDFRQLLGQVRCLPEPGPHE
jgi:hypothetical protein